MPRQPRRPAPGVVYHVLNRGNLRAELFTKPADYAAFARTLAEALARFPGIELFAWCLMPNHWHLVLRARRRGPDVSAFMRWLTITHTQRWRARTRTEGEGHLYQGRFKSFPVQDDVHFLTVCRYVEGNPLRAGLVPRAQDWQWSSLHQRLHNPSGPPANPKPHPPSPPGALIALPVGPPSSSDPHALPMKKPSSNPSNAAARSVPPPGTPSPPAASASPTPSHLASQHRLDKFPPRRP